jgi:hypothetical protein
MKQYMLCDAHTKQEILRSEPFSSAFRPNRAVIMMMMMIPFDFSRIPDYFSWLKKEDEVIPQSM